MVHEVLRKEMTVTEIDDKQRIFAILYECFKSDYELVQKWHIIAPDSIKNCAQRTFDDLMRCENLKFYSVYYGQVLIGYFGIEVYGGSSFLTGFMVQKEQRTKDNLVAFWDIIITAFKGGMFFSGVWSKNERAKQYLLNRGGQVVESNEDITLLKFN